VIVAAKSAGSYEASGCLRCFEGRVYDAQRDAWVACERCSGTSRVVVYVYPSRSAVLANAASNHLRAGAPLSGLRISYVPGWGGR
jgi:hypothetical protein